MTEQQRYYVVSEEELNEMLSAEYSLGLCDGSGGGAPPDLVNKADQAEAACRAREVDSIGGGMWQAADYDEQTLQEDME